MTAALPTSLQYGTVRWQVVGAAEDSADVGSDPDSETILGTATFRPVVDAIKYIGQPGDPVPKTILPRAYTYSIINGIMKDTSGNSDIRLVACDSPGTSPQGWQYLVEYQLSDGYTFGSFRFTLPANEVVDLTLVMPQADADGVLYVTGPAGPTFVLPDYLSETALREDFVAYEDIDSDSTVGTPDSIPGTLMRRHADGWSSASRLYVGPMADAPDGSTVARKDYVDNVGTSGATASTVVRRDEYGATAIVAVYLSSSPQFPDSAARKDYVDNAVGSVGVVDEVPNTVMRRNSDGETAAANYWINKPQRMEGQWATRKDYVDALGTASPTPDTIVRRNVDGVTLVASLGVVNAPTDPSHATRKDYVDALGSASNGSDTVVRRAEDGQFTTQQIWIVGDTSLSQHAARKDYVDGKSRKIIDSVSADRSLVATDEGRWLYSSGGVRTITVPADVDLTLPIGSIVEMNDLGGKMTVAAGAGATVMSPGGLLSTGGQYSTIRLLKIAVDAWMLSGDLGA